MDSLTWILLAGVVGIGVGIFASSVFFRKALEKKSRILLEEAKEKAEVLKKERILQAKEKFLQLKTEHEKLISRKNSDIQRIENRQRQKEQQLSQRIEEQNQQKKELDRLKENLNNQLEIVTKKQDELQSVISKQREQLENISGMSTDEAKKMLVESMKEEAYTEASSQINDILEEAKINANRQAKKIVIETIQRTAAEHAIENSVSVFNIENDEIKGRIIGREGRNIRTLESLTGIEIIIDDSPDAIILSGFDPVRREIARLSLHKLVTDGRIHPARIEEVVEKTTQQIDQEMIETGKRTIIDLGIHGLNHELIRLIGK